MSDYRYNDLDIGSPSCCVFRQELTSYQNRQRQKSRETAPSEEESQGKEHDSSHGSGLIHLWFRRSSRLRGKSIKIATGYSVKNREKIGTYFATTSHRL